LSSEERLASIKKRAEVLAEPFRSSLLWIPEGTATYNDRMSYWITIPWDNHKGMITLAGDAAHPLPPCMCFEFSFDISRLIEPVRGQGANHSICDASNLVDAIVKIHAGEGSREDEITGYDKEAIKRGAEEVRLSLDSAQNVHVWENLMASPMMQHGLTKMS
jgi:2-polyprenyl-6-methoxyphenol hydroxylase-like FAD-dependent oxidoreductase